MPVSTHVRALTPLELPWLRCHFMIVHWCKLRFHRRVVCLQSKLLINQRNWECSNLTISYSSLSSDIFYVNSRQSTLESSDLTGSQQETLRKMREQDTWRQKCSSNKTWMSSLMNTCTANTMQSFLNLSFQPIASPKWRSMGSKIRT